jgi:hypothetical protein
LDKRRTEQHCLHYPQLDVEDPPTASTYTTPAHPRQRLDEVEPSEQRARSGAAAGESEHQGEALGLENQGARPAELEMSQAYSRNRKKERRPWLL